MFVKWLLARFPKFDCFVQLMVLILMNCGNVADDNTDEFDDDGIEVNYNSNVTCKFVYLADDGFPVCIFGCIFIFVNFLILYMFWYF